MAAATIVQLLKAVLISSSSCFRSNEDDGIGERVKNGIFGSSTKSNSYRDEGEDDSDGDGGGCSVS